MIAQHQGILHRVCRAFTARDQDREDLLQDILYQLWRAWPTFSGRSKPSTWMYRVAVNTAITQRRRKERMPEHLSLTDLPVEPGAADPVLGRSDDLAVLERALRSLSPADRALILLLLEGLSYQEMGGILGISENALGVRLTRAKARLIEKVSELS